jgi:2,5-diketo-D-gluconate reductase A
VIREDARAYHAERGIVTESWSPLGGGGADELRHPVVTELADRYGRSPAQIVLRWHIELGLVAIPKSATPDRIRQNIEIFDFALSPEDVAAISAFDQGESAAVDSDRVGH